VLEKKFWYRRAKDGWQGLVSEPVLVSWKKERDLTGGLLDLVQKAYSSSSSSSSSTSSSDNKSAKKTLMPSQLALQKKIDNTGMGGLSFFAWFGFVGRRISAAENAEAIALEKKRRETGGKIEVAEEDEDAEEEEELDMSLEIFPDGEELALAFADDLWPGAIKYFSMFCEQSEPPFPPQDMVKGKANEKQKQHKHKNKTPSPTQISNPMTARTKEISLI